MMDVTRESVTRFEAEKDGSYTVYHDGQRVAGGLSLEEAASLCGDISYYGRPMKCVFSKGMAENCQHPFLHCNICPRRDKK